MSAINIKHYQKWLGFFTCSPPHTHAFCMKSESKREKMMTLLLPHIFTLGCIIEIWDEPIVTNSFFVRAINRENFDALKSSFVITPNWCHLPALTFPQLADLRLYCLQILSKLQLSFCKKTCKRTQCNPVLHCFRTFLRVFLYFWQLLSGKSINLGPFSARLDKSKKHKANCHKFIYTHTFIVIIVLLLYCSLKREKYEVPTWVEDLFS